MTATFNKKLQKGKLQSSDGLSDKEITALERLNAKKIEPPVLVLPRLQGDYTADTNASRKKTASYYRRIRTEPIDQLDTGPVHDTTLRNHMTPRTANVWP